MPNYLLEISSKEKSNRVVIETKQITANSKIQAIDLAWKQFTNDFKYKQSLKKLMLKHNLTLKDVYVNDIVEL